MVAQQESQEEEKAFSEEEVPPTPPQIVTPRQEKKKEKPAPVVQKVAEKPKPVEPEVIKPKKVKKTEAGKLMFEEMGESYCHCYFTFCMLQGSESGIFFFTALVYSIARHFMNSPDHLSISKKYILINKIFALFYLFGLECALGGTDKVTCDTTNTKLFVHQLNSWPSSTS